MSAAFCAVLSFRIHVNKRLSLAYLDLRHEIFLLSLDRRQGSLSLPSLLCEKKEGLIKIPRLLIGSLKHNGLAGNALQNASLGDFTIIVEIFVHGCTSPHISIGGKFGDLHGMFKMLFSQRDSCPSPPITGGRGKNIFHDLRQI